MSLDFIKNPFTHKLDAVDVFDSSVLSGYVPYTGATALLDLGTYSLIVGDYGPTNFGYGPSIVFDTHTNSGFGYGQYGPSLANKTISIVNQGVDFALFGNPSTHAEDIVFLKDTKVNGYLRATSYIFEKGTYDLTLTTEAITTIAKTITFPNATGTVALTSALASYVPYTGASGHVNLGVYDLTAHNLITPGNVTLTGSGSVFANGLQVDGINSRNGSTITIYNPVNMYDQNITQLGGISGSDICSFGEVKGITALTGDGNSVSTFGHNETTGSVKIGATRLSGGIYPGVWLATTTPSVTNYSFLYAGGSIFNTPSATTMSFRVNNANQMTIVDGTINAQDCDFTTTGTVTGEQLTSTDDAQIAGLLKLGTTDGELIIEGSTAGNARGAGAVDIQLRSAATQVAGVDGSVALGRNNTISAGYLGPSTLAGIGNTDSGYGKSSMFGISNTCAGYLASCFGYQNNTGSGYRDTLVGYINSITGAIDDCTILGANNAISGSAATSTVIAGVRNTVSAKYGGNAFGADNTVSTADGVGHAFGASNNVSGDKSSAFGMANTISSAKSTAAGYYNNIAGAYSTVAGYYSKVTGGNQCSLVGYYNSAAGYQGTIVGATNSMTGAGGSAIVGYGNTLSGYYSAIFGFNIQNNSANTIEIGDSNTTKIRVTGGNLYMLRDNAKVITGTGNDFEMFFDGTYGRLDGTGDSIRVGDATTNAFDIDPDGDISFKGTARIDWAKITANGATVTGFTTASAVADLQTANDGNLYTASEVAGGGNYLIVDFASVTAFNWVKVLGYYDGNSAHNIQIGIEITPFNGTAWHIFDSIEHQSATTKTMQNHDFFIPSDTAYINSGVVKIRFLHSSTTVNAHNLVLDEVSLQQ